MALFFKARIRKIAANRCEKPIMIARPGNSMAQFARLGWIIALTGAFALVFLATHPAQARQAETRKAQAGVDDAGFAAFVQELWPDAKARGVSRATFDAAFAGVAPSRSILGHTRKQAEFARPIWTYVDSAVASARVTQGRATAERYANVLAAAEARYGVDRWIIMGIWGMETSYGANTGGEDVIRALSTLAYARYRDDFFRDELIEALVILEEGHIERESMSGSWAGAMGQTQFMPSSFRKYAVDFSNDGRKNIWTNASDAIGSTANYLKSFGWERGLDWGYEVALPESYAPTNDEQSDYQPFSHFARKGIRRVDGKALPRSGEAVLMLPAGLRGPAFLATANFKVIKAYNNSTAYALGVALLADRIAGAAPLSASWPKRDKTLSPAQATQLQRILAAKGHYAGKIDGRFGEQAQKALRDWQARNGLTPDGYPTVALYERMRQQQP